MKNSILLGNCIDIMAGLPACHIDMALTDPPYLVRYRARDGRMIINDDNPDWLKPAFAQLHRVLKPDAFAVSFYGWNKADLFFDAWKSAGFRIAGHIVFRKKYSSKSAFLQYRHESAYLLVKGNPAFPAAPVPDVIDWTYTGNRLHPTQKPVGILTPLIEVFTQPGQTVLDPFAGSGSTLVAARKIGRAYVGIELDPQHHRTATNRLVEANIEARRTA